MPTERRTTAAPPRLRHGWHEWSDRDLQCPSRIAGDGQETYPPGCQSTRGFNRIAVLYWCMKPIAPTPSQMYELVVCRSLSLEKMPYLASTLLALRPLDAPGLGTFAVDATLRLYIDFEAVTPKGPVWCAEALLHECCHIFGDHAARSDDAAVTADERQMWNLSADAEANDDLAAAGCQTIEADGILPASLGEEDHQTAEFYLAALRRRRAARLSQARPGGSQAGNGGGTAPYRRSGPAAGDRPVRRVWVGVGRDGGAVRT